MKLHASRVRVSLMYLGYSTFWGFVALRSIHLDKKNVSDMALAVLAGPSIGLSRGHGAELWLLASFLLVPLLFAIVEARSLLVRSVSVIAFVLLWGGLGLFMA